MSETPTMSGGARGAAQAQALTPLQRAFLALEQTRAQLRAAQDAAREPIAIIGLGCRIPGGGNDPESFWQLLRDGVDATGPLPADRWDVDALYNQDPEHSGTIATRAGGFLRSVDMFDPTFFGITRREAVGMDPQQRLLLETCWEALEHAAQPPDRLERSATGVYVGVCGSDYAYMQLAAQDRTLLDAHFASGIAHSVASGRLSYLLGLQGPSLTVDTACSSSLVAVHLACQALRSGDCRMAVAGGVNLILSPELYIALSQARMLSPEGKCKTFDASADGFARAEGSAVVVLKRLSDAKADGDRILAVIRGTAVNQDGPSSGLTAPNGPAQEAVIRDALARGGISPKLVGYIEAHGTGTQLGDPLELRALGAVFGQERAEALYVGSLKTNVGHLEAAAGAAGLIKLVLSLQHREIPAHLHVTTPTPHIPWDALRLRVPTTHVPWPAIDGRRIGGVSAFGFSGTNAHIVVEEAPPAESATSTDRDDARRRVFILSGVDESSLRAVARRYAEAFAIEAFAAEHTLADVCYTAAVGRAHHPHRAAVLAGSIAELRERLEGLALGVETEGVRVRRVPSRDPARIAYLFTGQGAQYAGMGRELFEHEPVFRAAIERCAAALDGRLDRSLVQILYPSTDDDVASLDETAYTQPALFALEYALASLWASWGIHPDAVIGHSVGEYAAACVAGVFSVEDAARLIAERGRLMQSLPPGGAMAAIFAPEHDVAAALNGHGPTVSIAAVNAPGQTVVSGAAADVDAVCAIFTARAVRCQRLSVSHAFHSVLVEPILGQFAKAAATVQLDRPRLPVISNVTGAVVDGASITQPSYWRDHIRAAVRFGDGARSLAALRPDVCLEVGPHPTLLPLVQEAFGESAVAFVASMRKTTSPRDQLDDALGALFLAGASIDWRAVWSAKSASLADLPPYPFQRERCWFAPRRAAPSRGRETGHPLLGVRLHSALRDIVQFEQNLRAADLPFFRDHVVQGRTILPGAAFVEMALAAARRTFDVPRALEDVIIAEPLVVDGESTRRIQTVIRMPQGESATFEILSVPADDDAAPWQTHVSGTLIPVPDVIATVGATDRDAKRITAREHQAALAARGLTFGPSLHGIQHIDAADGDARATIALSESALEDLDRYLLSPALLDASLQTLSAAIPAGAARDVAYLPLAIESVRLYRTPGAAVTARAQIDTPARMPSDTLTGRLVISDTTGIVAELTGITLRAASAAASDAVNARIEDLYTVEWQPLDADGVWTPPVATLADEAGPVLDALVREHELDEYQQGFTVLESLVVRWIVKAFRELGWSDDVGAIVAPSMFAASLDILPRYHRLVPRLLAILGEAGVLGPKEERWVVRRSVDVGDPERDAVALLETHPSSTARIELTRRCGSVFAGILRGTVDPLQQLFPDGSTDLATSLYRDTPEAKAYNQLVRDTVGAIARRAPADGTLRVLEVGGGTGGTTAWVAPALDHARAEYLFTDVGPSLVAAARARFSGAHPFMSFTPFDLERSPVDQQIGGPFDVILASNVIHATADLRQTIGALRGLLAPGGTLLMLEVAGREWWIDITFGLTEGWWRFTDTDLRPDYPLLDRGQWCQLLSTLGFEAAEIGREQTASREVLLAARRLPGDAPSRGGRWLVIADAGGVGDAVADRLRRDARDVVVIDAGDDQHVDRLSSVLGDANTSDLAGIVYLRALDLPPLGDADAHPPTRDQEKTLTSLLTLVQSLGRVSFAANAAPRLWIATRGAQPVGRSSRIAVEQAPMLGLALGIAREHAELGSSRVDLDPSMSIDAQADSLYGVLGRAADDDEYAIRGETTFVARLSPSRMSCDATVDASGVERLVCTGSHGTLDELSVIAVPRVAPGAGQVEIEIRAAGLNFRDVMNAVAMRADLEPLGGECAARIVAIGDGVTEFAVGDDVVAIAEGCFATYAVTDVGHVSPLPKGLSFAEAATVPFTFMTAQFALDDCAGLASGETVLIHAGAGGVGQAAIQIAQEKGARIIATAGSETKRQVLRDQGVEHVLDSRSLAFGDEVRKLTDGRGVDVVLNSLAGDFIDASIACLGERGRFCEIGKRDIWTSEEFAEVRPDGEYFAIDLAVVRHNEPAKSVALFRSVMANVAANRYRALPLRAFPLHGAAEAFRFMAQARHIGKIVLVPELPMRAALDRLSPQATYLVTGGLTGIGLLTAQHLVERGARHLLLAGRRAATEATEAALATLREIGAEVRTVSIDVSDADALRDVFAEVDATMPPLRGVVHSAGALDDAALVQQTWSRFVTPMRAKVDGAWALHTLTRHRPLDFFILYSSVASVLGSSGQANHSAANAFLDALAAYRRTHGLTGASISWGAWSEIGAAVERGVEQRVGALGVDTIAPVRGLELLNAAIRTGEPHVTAFPVSWERFLEHRSGNGRLFFERVARRRHGRAARSVPAPATVAGAAGTLDVVALREASIAQRHALLLAFIGDQVARVVGAPSARSIAADQPLNEIGLDSLMAVELRNRLGRGLQLARNLPATMVFDHPTLEALTRYLDGVIVPQAAPPVAPAAPVNAADAIGDLSEEEIEALFANRTGKH